MDASDAGVGLPVTASTARPSGAGELRLVSDGGDPDPGRPGAPLLLPLRLVVGAAGYKMAFLAGMVGGFIDEVRAAVEVRPSPGRAPGLDGCPTVVPIVMGVSAGAVVGAAAALGRSADEMLHVVLDHRLNAVLGRRSVSSFLTSRVAYPDARVHSLTQDVVGTRTFADFRPPGGLNHDGPRPLTSTLSVQVYSADHGTIVLPRDLHLLGVNDMPVADALEASCRLPGMFPAVADFPRLFDGAAHVRVPHDHFAPLPFTMFEVKRPRPYTTRTGILYPVFTREMPAIWNRPRPYQDRTVRERTVFGMEGLNACLTRPRCVEDDFERGRLIGARWVREQRARRGDEGLKEFLGLRNPSAAPWVTRSRPKSCSARLAIGPSTGAHLPP